MTRTTAVIASLLFSLAASAQDSELVKVLVPVAVREPIPGANGSLWASVLTAHNAGPTTAGIFGTYDPGCAFLPCNNVVVPPGVMGRFFPSDARTPSMGIPGGPGAFVFLRPEVVAHLNFTLRVQDVSRQSETWGTEVPVILETAALTDAAQLLDVPTDSRFRLTLRIYDFDERPDADVNIRVLSPSGFVLAERSVRLLQEFPPGEFAGPSQIQIGDILSAIEHLESEPVVRIEVRPITAGLRYWAFLSITNNTTQHVTTITPR